MRSSVFAKAEALLLIFVETSDRGMMDRSKCMAASTKREKIGLSDDKRNWPEQISSYLYANSRTFDILPMPKGRGF